MTYKVYDGTNWVELAAKSDIKTYYTHNITISDGNNTANFTLTTSDSSAYNKSTFLQKISAMTNSWAKDLPLNGWFFEGANWEFDFPLLYVHQRLLGKVIYLDFRYFDGSAQPETLTMTFTANTVTISDVVSPA